MTREESGLSHMQDTAEKKEWAPLLEIWGRGAQSALSPHAPPFRK